MAQRKQLLLRLDPAVHDAVARWAADDLRSVNAQIEVLLRRELETAGCPERCGRSQDEDDPLGRESALGGWRPSGPADRWADLVPSRSSLLPAHPVVLRSR